MDSCCRSVLDGGVRVALNSLKFVLLMIVVHFLLGIPSLVAKEIRETSLARGLVSS